MFRRLAEFLKNLPQKSWEGFVLRSKYIGVQTATLGMFGVIGFPLFGWIWTDLFPQPFEAPVLRSLLTVACLIVVLLPYWPQRLKVYWPHIWFVLIIGCLPFFFGFMLLMNGFSPAWAMSYISSMMILSLLMDPKNFVIHQLVGTLVAYISYVVYTGGYVVVVGESAVALGELLVILAFSFSAAIAFNLTELVANFIRTESTINIGQRLAHELRTPLKAVINNSERVQEILGNDKESKVMAELSGMKSEAQHCLLTVDLLLASAKGAAPAYQDEPVSMLEICQESIDVSVRNPCQKAWFKVEASGDIQLMTSKVVVRHVFDNLITNAIYALKKMDRHEDGLVSIKIDGSKGVVMVEDNGCGIQSSDIDRIFDPYYTTKPTGTGIGLPYCRDVVTALGGMITVDSQEGCGSRFVIAFPSDRNRLYGLARFVPSS